MSHYKRTVDELYEVASLFWPEDLSSEVANISIVPLLLSTQEQFLALLSLKAKDLDTYLQLIQLAGIPANLFLKHLMVLADFGGEMMQRINANFLTIFPAGEMTYIWNDKPHTYKFRQLPVSGTLNNQRLGVSGSQLAHERVLDDLLRDAITLLTFGSACTEVEAAEILSKCELGTYLGQPTNLNQYVKQRYIWVSRITSGSQTNSLGHLAEDFVRKHIEDKLGHKYLVQERGNLPGVTHTGKTRNNSTTFDIVVSKQNEDKYVAIEVSFQVTTNSVIERKAGQAQARYNQIDTLGYKMAYVLDGAGNFQRKSALNTICDYSHCTVAFSRQEMDILCQFIEEYLN